jgi:hypothetical protein
MSKNVISMLGAAVVGLVLVGSATQGCGGSSSDPASVCNTACTKAVSCSMGTVTMSTCVSGCEAQTKDSSGQSCSNSDAILSAFQKCGAMSDCTAAVTCAETTIPKCAGTSGSAGTSGTAGTSGSAGASGGGTAGTSGGGTAGASGGGTAGTSGTSGGTTCDTACAKADLCANALAVLVHTDAGTGSLKTLCDSQSAADQLSTVSTCNMILSSAAMAGAAEPAACK